MYPSIHVLLVTGKVESFNLGFDLKGSSLGRSADKVEIDENTIDT